MNLLDGRSAIKQARKRILNFMNLYYFIKYLEEDTLGQETNEAFQK